ncbi:PHD finger protein [Spatholobus suberectus]|nr:PHD finger protein [Spatholobus suberectus]
MNERRLKQKRRVITDHCDFLSFPTAEFSIGKPFRSSVRRFLSHHTHLTLPSSLSPTLVTWQMLLQLKSFDGELGLSSTKMALDIIEENVIRTRSSIYCIQCRLFGWSEHPVCRKRYHFIIRADSSEPFQRPCSRCANPVQLTEASRCKCCNSAITINEIEDWLYLQIEYNNTHLLHGVVHSNGYGHLLTLNGREGGSKFLSGSDIMGFWDRLCVALSVRKVGVMDFSRKFGLEYRLLHAITNGCSWYGNWGYEFGTGSYALTQDVYQKAVKTLSSLPLPSLLVQGRGARTRLQSVIFLYQSLATTALETIQDLFCFLLTFISKPHKILMTKTSQEHPSTNTCNVLCAWTRNDVEKVQQAIVEVLLALGASKEENWVSWRALKGAVSKGAASLDLVDYGLKHLGGKLAPNGMVVFSRCNPISNAVEFRLGLLSNALDGSSAISSHPSEEQVISDFRFLIDSIVCPDKMASNAPQIVRKLVADSVTKILDCKQFVKDYKPEKVAAGLHPAIRLWCSVELSDQPRDPPTPPPELIILRVNATLDDLKSAVTSVFQEVYVMYKKFQAEKLPEFGSVDDSYTLKFLLGTSGSVRIQGTCPTKYGLSRFRMEKGTEAWKVDCPCGAKNDDGERMLECENCGVWQHNRCTGIDDSDDIPLHFVCLRCIDSNDIMCVCACPSPLDLFLL